ncbi:hypothetical protein FJQ98_18560 [Lysinibacillus agricola]|uniref:Uncharacterized protein n=1 Tax=Lysinibacillus agricola TaxID=2590012 RepID=A0ABX7APJ0_9BACI|nr:MULTISPECIES: polymorphic toxin type 17 domain-containing protein [Lysinibacillus]QQP11207.1 hypothetical protein FJQ98_18560 [Lysinibacillus agricola]
MNSDTIKSDPIHGFSVFNPLQFEWDVQLSEKEMREWGNTKNGDKYINVAPDGTLSH